jgi:proline dehydrogenase
LRDFANVGVCLQAYLYRTAGDLASLAGLGGGVRLVKGAYAEPATAAYPRKSDVDANFFGLVTRMLEPDARAAGLHAVFGTHDVRLIRRIQRYADSMRVGREAYEFHLLFGVRHAQQVRLSEEGHRVRVLISYGDEWFPWYMRRLAERPANLWFVATSVLSK